MLKVIKLIKYFLSSSQCGFLHNTSLYKISQSSFIFAPFISVSISLWTILSLSAWNFRTKTNRKNHLPFLHSRRILSRRIVPAGLPYSFEMPVPLPYFYNTFCLLLVCRTFDLVTLPFEGFFYSVSITLIAILQDVFQWPHSILASHFRKMKAIQNKLRVRVNGTGVRNEEYTSEVESRGAYLIEPTKTREWDRSPLHKCIRRGKW